MPSVSLNRNQILGALTEKGIYHTTNLSGESIEMRTVMHKWIDPYRFPMVNSVDYVVMYINDVPMSLPLPFDLVYAQFREMILGF